MTAATIPERVATLEESDRDKGRRLSVVETRQDTDGNRIRANELKIARMVAWAAGAAAAGAVLGGILAKYVLA